MDEIGEIKKQIIVMIEDLGKEEKSFLLIIYGLLRLHREDGGTGKTRVIK